MIILNFRGEQVANGHERDPRLELQFPTLLERVAPSSLWPSQATWLQAPCSTAQSCLLLPTLHTCPPLPLPHQPHPGECEGLGLPLGGGEHGDDENGSVQTLVQSHLLTV